MEMDKRMVLRGVFLTYQSFNFDQQRDHPIRIHRKSSQGRKSPPQGIFQLLFKNIETSLYLYY